ncbi:MAG: exodeoxyribonuclease VII small subunit [Bacteroidia bacterium]|nr:MAG: exodeoxyribonuclease VII small subunit [Bacteroidia bacterium]
MEKKTGYREAFEELQQIVADMEEGEIGVDELSDKVKRAAELIQICKEKLYHTESDVQKILDGLEEEKSKTND